MRRRGMCINARPLQRTRALARSITMALLLACLVAATLASCASRGRVRPAAEADARASGSDSVERVPAAKLDAARAAVYRAVALSRSGDMEGALAAANAALESARDMGIVSSALEAKAWALMLAGSRKDAADTLAQAASIGAPVGALRAVLEFRLAAADGLVAARKRADSLKLQAIGDRATLAMAVMLGDKDLRDIRIDSPEAASELATYLVGYRLAPEPATAPAAAPTAAPAATPAATAVGPVVVISEPESVGADEATLAVARLSCKDALVRRGRFRVVDAESRKAAMDELELSLSGATAGDKDKAVGQLFSADYVASGSVVKTDAGWLVAFTLASAADGHIVASDFSVAQDHAAIMTEAGRFAESLDGLASSPQD